MTSVLRVLLVVALSSLPGFAGAATAERQAHDSLQDSLLGLYTLSGPDIIHASLLFSPQFPYDSDPCSCAAYETHASSFYGQRGLETDECHDFEIYTPEDDDYSCRCSEPVRLHRVHDDNIRGQMRLGTDLLRIVPLWQADTAVDIEPDARMARDGHGCGAGAFGPAASNGLGGAMSGIASAGGSALIYSATLGAGGGAAGGLSGGGSSGGSGGLVGRNSPLNDVLDDSPDFDSPTPAPLPPAGLMFLSALSLLALGRSLRKRFVANKRLGEAGA